MAIDCSHRVCELQQWLLNMVKELMEVVPPATTPYKENFSFHPERQKVIYVCMARWCIEVGTQTVEVPSYYVYVDEV